MTDSTQTVSEAARSPAQFFFEIGFGACFAEALVRSGGKAPFPFSDAIIEHAWDVAGEAHDDHAEFDAYLAAANSRTATPPAPAMDEVEQVAMAMWAVSAEPEHGDTWDAVRDKPWGENFRVHARAAIAAMTPKQEAVVEAKEDAELLDMLQNESWDLRCFAVPTGGDDADVGWQVIGHWQAEPHERVIAEVYHDDLREALRHARAALSPTEADQ